MRTPSHQDGAIELILGPVFSGKTTELLRRARRFAAAGKKVYFLSFKKDGISTHDRASTKSKQVACLQEADNLTWQYDVLAIDEGQLFPDLAKYADKWANDGKVVLVAALDGDSQRRAFEPVQRMLPLCESLIKLTAVCKACHGEAAFTWRAGNEADTPEAPSGADRLEPRCRGCHRAGEATRSEFGSENASAGKKQRKSGGKAGGSRRSSLEALADSTNLHASLQMLNLR